MSAIKDGGPAFPLLNPAIGYHADIRQTNTGLSVRDYFAAKAMPFVAGRADLDNTGAIEWAAACYEIADAMLAAREVQS